MALVSASSISFTDGSLTWTTATTTTDDHSGSGSIKDHEILFVLQSSDLHKTQQRFIICALSEDPNNPETPFRILFLTTDTLPDHLRQHHHLITALPTHLLATSPNRVDSDGQQLDVIVSVKSGTNLALHFWQSVLQPLLALSREILRRQPAGAGPLQSGGDEDKDAAQVDQGIVGGGGEPHVIVTQTEHSVRQYAAANLAASTRSPPDDANKAAGGALRRTIILLSGDGGVVDLLNGRENSNASLSSSSSSSSPPFSPPPVIALIPLGTGNALFHSLHKPIASTTDASPLVLALRTLFLGKPADLPSFRASFSPGARICSFAGGDGGSEDQPAGTADDQQQQQQEQDMTPVNYLQGAIVASYGFHASIVYESDTPAYRVHGAKRFGMVAQDLLRESHPYTAHVDIRSPATSDSPQQDQEDQDFRRLPRDTHAYILTTLVSNMERTFCISPASKPLDGKLRLVHFGPVGGERTMEAMMAAYDGGKHVDLKWDKDGEEVGYEQVGEMRVTVLEEEARWRKVCVDGTIVEIPQGGSMSVKTNAESGFQVLVQGVEA